LAAMAMVTGALHEDGLADMFDGFGGGCSPERKLAIMRDSRIGGYGALALMIAVLMRVAALAAMGDPPRVMKAVCLAGLLGRGAILVVLLVLRPARAEGLGAAFANMDRRNAWPPPHAYWRCRSFRRLWSCSPRSLPRLAWRSWPTGRSGDTRGTCSARLR
jgi:cobalamin synthase